MYNYFPNQWKFLSKKDLGDGFTIPGYRKRAYLNLHVYSMPVVPNVEFTSENPSIRFMVVGYVGPEDYFIELKYCTVKYGDWGIQNSTFRDVPIDILREMIQYQKSMHNSGLLMLDSIVEIGGRTMLKFPISFKGGVTLDTIGHTNIGKLIWENGYALHLMIVYPDAIKSVVDAVAAYEAILGLNRLTHSVSDRWVQCNQDGFRSEIARLDGMMRDYRERESKVCETAAENMNILADKYGIMVEL